jgi:UPF0755 protein
MKTLQRLFMFMVVVALTLGVAFGIVWEIFVTTPMVSEAAGYKYQVRPGASFKSVATDLHKQQVLSHPYLFMLLVLLRGDEHNLKAGEYLIPVATTPDKLITQITSGTGMLYHVFTIVPGTTFKQLRTALDKCEDLTHESKDLTNEAIMQRLGFPKVDPEGLFFPDTYFFVPQTSDLSLLKRSLAKMRSKLNAAWATRAADLPYKTPYDALIAASIIEKESGVKMELPIISGVLVNRLRKNIKLQFDPTVIYGIGERYSGVIHRSDLHDSNAYNTYMHTGLPPTPISLPGMVAINAIMHPDVNDYLYFVARGDGLTHQFSRTLAEHYIAVAAGRKFQPQFFNGELVKQYWIKMLPPPIVNIN